MEVVIDYEAVKGGHNEATFKELALLADGVIRTFHFQTPYDMRPHGSAENGLNWDDGHILSSVTDDRYRCCVGIRTSLFIRH